MILIDPNRLDWMGRKLHCYYLYVDFTACKMQTAESLNLGRSSHESFIFKIRVHFENKSLAMLIAPSQIECNKTQKLIIS